MQPLSISQSSSNYQNIQQNYFKMLETQYDKIKQINGLINKLTQKQIKQCQSQNFLVAQKIKHEIQNLQKEKEKIQGIKTHSKFKQFGKQKKFQFSQLFEGIQQFKKQWDQLIKQMMLDYIQVEKQLKAKHCQQLQDLEKKFQNDKQNILLRSKALPPLPKIIQAQKKLNYYAKNRQYLKADMIKRQISHLFNEYLKKNNKQIQRQIKIQKNNLRNKHKKQLQILQIKFEQILNQKIAYRDKFLQILNKKAKIQAKKLQKSDNYYKHTYQFDQEQSQNKQSFYDSEYQIISEQNAQSQQSVYY